MYNVAILGAGQISKYYISALTDSSIFNLSAICDIFPPDRHAKGVFFTVNIEDILDNNNIDCVFITLPNYLHYPSCIKLLNSGKHVCCEKPLAFNYNESKNIVNIANNNNKIIFTAFHRRYNESVQSYKIRDNIKINNILAEYHDNISIDRSDRLWYFDEPLSGGGCIIDSGSNVFDVIEKKLEK